MLPHAFESVGVDIDGVNAPGELPKSQAGFEPPGKIVGGRRRAQARFDEVVRDRPQAHTEQTPHESIQVIGHKFRRNGQNMGFAKVKRLEGLTVLVGRVFFQVFFDRADDVLPQLPERRILPDIEGFQLLRQAVFVQSGQHPMSEVVGKSFGQKVMLLHGVKRVGENGAVADAAQTLEQLPQRMGPVPADADQGGGRHKDERLLGFRQTRNSFSFLKNFSTSRGEAN